MVSVCEAGAHTRGYGGGGQKNDDHDDDDDASRGCGGRSIVQQQQSAASSQRDRQRRRQRRIASPPPVCMRVCASCGRRVCGEFFAIDASITPAAAVVAASAQPDGPSRSAG